MVADSHIPYLQDYFGACGELVVKPGRRLTKADVKHADMLLVRSVTPVNQELLAGTSVQFVGSVTAGADHLDMEWLQKAGIDFFVAEGFNAPPVADYVISVIAALQHRQQLVKEKMKVAIIGVGHVGKQVAERLLALQAEVIFCDPLRAQQEKDFVSQPLETIADCDLVCLHVPLTKAGPYPTYHFIDKSFLLRQKRGCILLNASRGNVIDANQLLHDGSHLHWCLDVWPHEPGIDKNLLEKTVIATPHIAGYSIQSKIRGIDMIHSIACQKKIIQAPAKTPVAMPRQKLAFSGKKHHWQDIVLGVFNPLVMTAMMRHLLLNANEVGPKFDEMRNQFNYRHEFAYTDIADVDIPAEDKKLLTGLGLKFCNEELS